MPISMLVSQVADPIQTIANTHDEIILALIAVGASMIGLLGYVIRNGYYAKAAAGASQEAAKQATKANDAVNNIGPGEHRLYEVIARIEAKQDEFDKKWGALPVDMDNAVSLAETIHSMDKKIDAVALTLADHVEWEMQQKYAKGEQ